MSKPIIKTGTRILRPYEYETLKRVIPLQDHRNQLDTLLYTGMRYREMEQLRDNPDWYDPTTGSISIPETAGGKRERTMKERTVYLSAQGMITIPYFFQMDRKITESKVWSMNLKRWGKKAELDPAGLNARTTRKTWESWLCVTYPQVLPLIAMSQGHTLMIAMQHYLNLPFTGSEVDRIKLYTAGWTGLKKM